ncbi:hypothetical protein FoTM2_004869 [Fusarium oxysporum f. sp. vasinfectum]|nr:hypothetical protein FoTM2_004869 [Fusarium oxysporum f. sp. vasinfectum]
MEPTSDKKTSKETPFKRHNLFDRGFFYDDEISTNGLPAHVEALRELMLDFACDDFGQEASGKDEEIANQGTDLTNRKVVENHWQNFFRDNFFKPLEESISASNSSWEYHIVSDINYRWVIFNVTQNRLGSTMPDRLKNESAPQPDYAFYFPMLPANSSISETAPHIALEPHKELALFSLSALEELYTHGLRPSPFHPFQKNVEDAHLKCFPWLVVEFKPKRGANGVIKRLKEEVYCQAVNGSGCAMMQCIWDGDMRNSHDIVKFRFILKNTYAWATREFRPLMVKYIDQWKYVYSEAFLNNKRAAVAFRKEEIESRSRQQSPEAEGTPNKQLDRTIDGMMSLNLNDGVTPTPNRYGSPVSACSTPQSGVRRSARIKALRDAQLSPGLTSQLERSASRLKETIAAGPSKRRESGTKFLAAPIEVEVDGSTSDEEDEEYDESDDDDEECEDDDEADEEESDEENLVWDYVRRKYVPVYV